MKPNFQRLLSENQNVLVVCKSKEHDSFMLEVNSFFSHRFNKICFITMNKPTSTLLERFQQAKLDYAQYHFIDCVPKSSKNNTSPQEEHISSPTALTELAIMIEKQITTSKIDLVILDDISTLLIYNHEIILEKFLHSIMTKIRMSKAKGMFIISADAKQKMISDLSLFVDAVVTI